MIAGRPTDLYGFSGGYWLVSAGLSAVVSDRYRLCMQVVGDKRKCMFVVVLCPGNM